MADPETRDKPITRILPQTYAIRGDNSIAVPVPAQAMLQWQPGDLLQMEVDLTGEKLILSKRPVE